MTAPSRQALRRRPLACRRVAADGRDAHRQRAPAPCGRDRRAAEGRLAVRGDLGLDRHVRRPSSPTTTTTSPSSSTSRAASAENTAALEKSLAAFPVAVVETREEFKDTRTAEITQSLQILYALLGLSVIVSLFGVINTLVLSVFERTRELGMLRAIRMTRRQVRRMIRHESIVTALIGAALGIRSAYFLAVLTTAALSSTDRVRGAGRDARRLRRRRDPRRDARGDPAGAACLELNVLGANMSSGHAVAEARQGRSELLRLARTMSLETAIVRASLAAVALRPRRQLPPAAAGHLRSDHLTSGLVPVAILLGVAVVYPRLRAGARGRRDDVRGAQPVLGFPAVYHLLHGISGDDYTGLLATAAGRPCSSAGR